MVCIGSLHWDYLGRAGDPISQCRDQPGAVSRSAGGVAFNLARALLDFGFDPELVSAVGSEAEGDELIREVAACGLRTAGVARPALSRSDSCLIIEDPEKMIATVADCRLIEATGAKLVDRFKCGDSAAGNSDAGGVDHVVLDCNIPESALSEIAMGSVFGRTELSLVSASDGKIDRASILCSRLNTAIYANMQETRILLSEDISCAAEGARGLIRLGFARAVVTNGSLAVADATLERCHELSPRQIGASRFSGAGDRFAAAHIAARLRGKNQAEALAFACDCAGAFVSNSEA